MRPTLLALALTCALATPATLRAQATAALPADTPTAITDAAACDALADAADRATCMAAAAGTDAVALDLGPAPAGAGIDCLASLDEAQSAACRATEAAEQAERAAAASTPPTDAAGDVDALAGALEPYDPVADPTLPPEAATPPSYDPWERWNRRSHAVNNAIDRRVAKPLARAYMAAVPRPVRLGVSNFFNNLGQPVSALNALLQGKPRQAGQSAGRFLLNSTLGIGGVFDPATDARLPRVSEDFGQTLGVWGWRQSRYVELPVFGPRTVRDVVGLAGDAPLSLLRQVPADGVRIPLQGLQLVDLRTRLMSTDALREGVEDDYALVRDAWLQRRNYQIVGDRMDEGSGDAGLPDYLQDETPPVIPVDAMPVIPGG